MDVGQESGSNSGDASASFGDTESTDQFTGVAIKGGSAESVIESSDN